MTSASSSEMSLPIAPLAGKIFRPVAALPRQSLGGNLHVDATTGIEGMQQPALEKKDSVVENPAEGAASSEERNPRKKRAISFAHVKCRYFESRGCPGKARTLGGVGKQHYAYFCPVCNESWAQLRPSAVGEDGDLHVRETKRKPPALLLLKNQEQQMGDHHVTSTQTAVEQGFGICRLSSQQGMTGAMPCFGNERSMQAVAATNCTQGNSSMPSVNVNPFAGALLLPQVVCASHQSDGESCYSGLTLTKVQDQLDDIELKFFGTLQEGSITHRLARLEMELGILKPAGATIQMRLALIIG
mmetsp:Transcript_22075/g.46780  ORF Transcript_22075/g.46780 Transcript_22075/m.46780 type:complete len:301 (+) Transcript_22075:176-1078(+)